MTADSDCYTSKLYKFWRGSKKIRGERSVCTPGNISLGGPGGTLCRADPSKSGAPLSSGVMTSSCSVKRVIMTFLMKMLLLNSYRLWISKERQIIGVGLYAYHGPDLDN